MFMRRKMKIPPWAKYAVAAMLLADGAGIYLAHDRINQPVVDGGEEAVLALADPQQGDAGDLAGLARSNRELALAPPPLPRPAEAPRAPLPLRPLELVSLDDVLSAARIEQRADRVAEIAVAPVAVRRSSQRQARLFTRAFARPVGSEAQVGSTIPDVDFAQVCTARDAAEQSAVSYSESQADVSPLPQPELSVAEPAAEPFAAQTGSDEAPAEPAPVAGGESELPPL